MSQPHHALSFIMTLDSLAVAVPLADVSAVSAVAVPLPVVAAAESYV